MKKVKGRYVITKEQQRVKPRLKLRATKVERHAKEYNRKKKKNLEVYD